MRRSAAHGLALALAAFPLVGSAFIALFGLVWGLGLQCDESCTGEDWRHTAGAPQWTVLTVAGFVVFAAGIALFVFVYRARSWPALVSVAVGAVTAVAALSWWGVTWSAELSRHPLAYGTFACVVLAGVVASLLCAPDTAGV
jgi:hypothetical protein